MPLSSTPFRLLIVEDDRIVSEVVSTYLRTANLDVVQAFDMGGARTAFRAGAIDLLVVDINLPDGSGLDLVAELRRARDCAVILMTSPGSAEDRIRGLEHGADYLAKPVNAGELLARVRAVLRRYRPRPPVIANRPSLSVIDLDGWTLDLVRRELADGEGHLVRLTRAEFDLFAALVQSRGIALSRDYLIEVVASADAATNPRTIDVMVSRIRRKLGKTIQPSPRIVTSPGEGYIFENAA